jgi:hypothetical protein
LLISEGSESEGSIFESVHTGLLTVYKDSYIYRSVRVISTERGRGDDMIFFVWLVCLALVLVVCFDLTNVN